MLLDEIMVRRYSADEHGRRVLIGLTFEETGEFESIEATSPVHESGKLAWIFEGPPTNEREQRWLELYVKHQSAWEVWRG